MESLKANRRQIGSRYEKLAADYLEEQGLKVLNRNFYSRQGELDLVCLDGKTLVFVEVKYRKDGKKGAPAEAVDARKQRCMRETARCYLYSNRYGEDTPCRFDVVAILGETFHWIKNAF